VVLNPVVKIVSDDGKSGGEIIYIGGVPYALEDGKDASNVRVIDSDTICVVTPQGKMDTFGIIVINPDGGASEVYNDLKYGLPELQAPSDVEAELVFDRYIKVNWKAVSGVSDYEIYVVTDSSEMELIGITDLTSYLYTELEPNTRYRFIVKAVGNFGSSKPSFESNTVKTGSRAGPPDNDGSLNEKTVMERAGDVANVIIGEKDFNDGIIVIDLTKGILAGCRDVVISIPASVVTSSGTENINIIGGNFRIELNPNAFNSSRLREYKDRNDAGVRFKVSQYDGSMDIKNPVSGEALLSAQYLLQASIFVGRDYTAMDYLASDIKINMNFDAAKAEMCRLNKMSLCRYDGYDNGWATVKNADRGDISISASANRLGIYSVIGRRQ
jgi:hypothetical protein